MMHAASPEIMMEETLDNVAAASATQEDGDAYAEATAYLHQAEKYGVPFTQAIKDVQDAIAKGAKERAEIDAEIAAQAQQAAQKRREAWSQGYWTKRSTWNI